MSEVNVEVKYTNRGEHPDGGPYDVTITDKWGVEEFTVTDKTIKRAGSFEKAVRNRMAKRYREKTGETLKWEN